jgi:LAGLIDADG DNA endonuclease family protein
MDDGGRGAHTPRGLVINTSCFSAEEQSLLQMVMKATFGIEVSVHRAGSGFHLYIRSRSFSSFSDLVSPHLVAQLRYKLPVDPVTTSPPRRRDSDSVREREPIYGRYDTSALTPSVR